MVLPDPSPRTGNYGPEVPPAPAPFLNLSQYTGQHIGGEVLPPDSDWTTLIELPVTYDGARTLIAFFSAGVEVLGTNPVVFFRIQLDGVGEFGGFSGIAGNGLVTTTVSAFGYFPPVGGGVATRTVRVQWKTLFFGTSGQATVVANGLNGCPQLATVLLP